MTQTPTDALRLVPVEPTEAMQNAGVDAATNLFEGWVDEGQVSTLYRAMLAAAPDMMCCDNCGTVRGKADECDCSLHDGTPPVWVSAAPASPLPGGGWRTDFENAPKDGTDVLVAPHMAVVSWDFGAERWIVGVIPLNDDRTIADDWTVQPVMFFEQYLSNWGVEPTHWMPLPAAPTGEPK